MSAPASPPFPDASVAALRARAVVDLDAYAANLRVLAERARGAAVMAVVKADAYGHGALACARTALTAGATWLGVAHVDEGLALRRAGISAPVLVLVEPAPEQLAAAAESSLDVGIGSLHGLQAALATAGPMRVHLKADTGLSRGGAAGAAWAELVEVAARAVADGRVVVAGVWSHLACADDPAAPSNAAQLAAFAAALDVADRAGLRPEVRHLANSAGVLAHPDAHYDLVRVGIASYGLSPGPELGSAAGLGLRPVMTLSAQVVLTKRVPAGVGVSYGHRYVTDRETTLAVVPLGYADGVPRAASGIGPLQLGGRRRTVAGTVCMDQLVVDVGDDAVAAGDLAVLFGPGADGEPTADDWANLLGTIGYELVTRVGARVPRVHVGVSAAGAPQ